MSDIVLRHKAETAISTGHYGAAIRVPADKLLSLLDAAEAVAAMERWGFGVVSIKGNTNWQPHGVAIPHKFWKDQPREYDQTWPNPTSTILAAAKWLEQEDGDPRYCEQRIYIELAEYERLGAGR